MNKKLTIEKPVTKKCESLQDVRNCIDEIDESIILLLCERIQYIYQAAQFKDSVADTRRFGRIEAIICRAKAYANITGVSEDYIEAVYRFLIDESIRQEKSKWLELNDNKIKDE